MLLQLLPVVFAILLSRRKVVIDALRPDDAPGVDAERMRAWQRRASRTYALGATASLIQALVGALSLLFSHRYVPAAMAHGIAWLPYTVERTIFALWIVALIVTGVRSARDAKAASDLGIPLGAPVRPSRDA